MAKATITFIEIEGDAETIGRALEILGPRIESAFGQALEQQGLAQVAGAIERATDIREAKKKPKQ